MTIDIDAIRRREQAATPGPWVSDDADVYAEDTGDLIAEGLDTDNPEQSRADAEFAAHARTDIPALLAELDVMREVVEAAKAWRAQFGEFGPLDSADTPSGDLTDAVDALDSGTGGA